MFTFSNVAVVMVFAKLDSKLNDDPDADGNEAACADLGHDLQHLMRQNLIYNALACDEQEFKRKSTETSEPSGCWAHCGHR